MTEAGTPPLAALVDTNVFLDVALARTLRAGDAVRLLDGAERGRLRAFVAGHAVTTVYYVVERDRDRKAAVRAVQDLLSVATVVELGDAEFQRALAMGLRDFEDAVQVAACLRVGADYLVTRNPRDFRGALVTVRSPGEVLAILANG